MLCGAAGGGRAIKTIVASGSRPGPETPLNQRGRKAKEILTGSLPSLALVGLSLRLSLVLPESWFLTSSSQALVRLGTYVYVASTRNSRDTD